MSGTRAVLRFRRVQKPDVLLNFGAVDYSSIVWVTDTRSGITRAVMFHFNSKSRLFEERVNRITASVEDRQDPRQPRGSNRIRALPFGIDYYNTTGIWQTVLAGRRRNSG
jgi:hypothetical protein